MEGHWWPGRWTERAAAPVSGVKDPKGGVRERPALTRKDLGDPGFPNERKVKINAFTRLKAHPENTGCSC